MMRIITFLAALTMTSVIGAAHADQTRNNAGAVFVSSPKEEQRTVALAVITDVVRRGGWIVADKIYSALDSNAAAECLRKSTAAQWPCLGGILRDKRIQQLALVTVDERPGKDGNIDTRIIQRLVFAQSDTLWIAERYCTQCTNDRLGKLARDLAEELIERAAVDRGQSVISIQATPPGSRLYIDSQIVGITRASVGVAPGPHIVTVEFDKYETATVNVKVAPDTMEPVVISLKPRAGAQGIPPQHRQDPADGHNPGTSGAQHPASRNWPRIVGGTLAVVGAAAVVTGGIWIAIDQDDVTDPDRDNEVPRRFRNSGLRGAVVGASGLAVAGVGAYFWWRYGNGPAKSKTMPTVAPTSGGATIGITGSF